MMSILRNKQDNLAKNSEEPKEKIKNEKSWTPASKDTENEDKTRFSMKQIAQEIAGRAQRSRWRELGRTSRPHGDRGPEIPETPETSPRGASITEVGYEEKGR